MARLNWGVVAERFFETGVDHGVLYTGDGIGVPWNGLTSVNETPTGGDPAGLHRRTQVPQHRLLRGVQGNHRGFCGPEGVRTL